MDFSSLPYKVKLYLYNCLSTTSRRRIGDRRHSSYSSLLIIIFACNIFVYQLCDFLFMYLQIFKFVVHYLCFQHFCLCCDIIIVFFFFYFFYQFFDKIFGVCPIIVFFIRKETYEIVIVQICNFEVSGSAIC